MEKEPAIPPEKWQTYVSLGFFSAVVPEVIFQAHKSIGGSDIFGLRIALYVLSGLIAAYTANRIADRGR